MFVHNPFEDEPFLLTFTNKGNAAKNIPSRKKAEKLRGRYLGSTCPCCRAEAKAAG
jgi:hypothetical protein